jgi:preprotein translocase subunit SecE
VGEFIQELFRVGLYKRSQGRIARQVTFAALAILVALAGWSLYGYYSAHMEVVTGETAQTAHQSGIIGRYVIPWVVVIVGLWASFRVVQFPPFADFLISVEAEMNKVSWPTRTELFRSSMVVMLMIFILAGVLFVYDAFWSILIKDWLGLG